ncbi:MAG: acetate--CoA ligase family protein [Chloroflexi bacterium]|nr:acetate--CoA ligase family protein [Chloroflexota bacterium]
MAKTKKDAVRFSGLLDFPVALKVASPDIVHKSDSGGVKLGLRNEAQVNKAFDEIMEAVRSKNPKARVHGVAIQKMARPGLELSVGMTRDPLFGPVIMFGLGGILIEILKDVSLRVVPLSKRDAAEMVREIRGYPLLQGYRNLEPVNVAAIEALILKLSKFVEKTPVIKEVDLNPVLGYKDRVVAVDARIILNGDSR